MSEHTFGYAVADGAVARPARRRLRLVADQDEIYDSGGAPRGAADAFDADAVVDAEVALAALEHAADLMSRADLDGLSDRGLWEHTVTLDRQATRLEAQRLRALRRVEVRGAFVEDACVTAGSWFKLRTGRDGHVGARLGRWARRLGRFALLRAAFESGDVTVDHVTVVLRAASTARRTAALVDHEDTLVDLARKAAPKDVKVAVTAICDAVDHRDPDPDPDAGPSDARGLFHARTFAGLGDLQATLDPVTAERFDTLLHAYAQPDPPGSDGDGGEVRTPAQARHDAFDAILQAAEEHPDVSRVQGARPHLLIFCDLFTLLGRADLASRPTVRFGSGTPVDLNRIARLLHDAKATGVLGLGPFRPVAFGRTRRVIPGWLRPLLAMVHGHCRGPGCDRPAAWTQAMHLNGDWAQGATTEWDTTAPGCHAHHDLIDIVGWHVDLDPDTAQATWTSPDRHTAITTNPPDP